MAYKHPRDLRKDADLTQAQIAEIIRMHKTTYIRYESGEREIPLSIAFCQPSIPAPASTTSQAEPTKIKPSETVSAESFGFLFSDVFNR